MADVMLRVGARSGQAPTLRVRPHALQQSASSARRARARARVERTRRCLPVDDEHAASQFVVDEQVLDDPSESVSAQFQQLEPGQLVLPRCTPPPTRTSAR